MDYRPADQLMAGLDRAARLLLEEPREVWQAALLPHLRPRSGRSTFAGVVGARQMLDAVLADPCGGHAPGALVRMEDGGLAVVTGVRGPPRVGWRLRYLEG
ncbi:hypothetical protein [Streptosporangium sp. H16]|uniref:hypothetical protein n=1 Tax=Streptosporangium sp. H16 TaxID=3444184 RepID=UPI003F794FC2